MTWRASISWRGLAQLLVLGTMAILILRLPPERLADLVQQAGAYLADAGRGVMCLGVVLIVLILLVQA